MALVDNVALILMEAETETGAGGDVSEVGHDD